MHNLLTNVYQKKPLTDTVLLSEALKALPWACDRAALPPSMLRVNTVPEPQKGNKKKLRYNDWIGKTHCLIYRRYTECENLKTLGFSKLAEYKVKFLKTNCIFISQKQTVFRKASQNNRKLYLEQIYKICAWPLIRKPIKITYWVKENRGGLNVVKISVIPKQICRVNELSICHQDLCLQML